MPLIQGHSEESRKRNVETLIKEGKNLDQSLAISYAIQNGNKKGLNIMTPKLKRLIGIKTREINLTEIDARYSDMILPLRNFAKQNVYDYNIMESFVTNNLPNYSEEWKAEFQKDYKRCNIIIQELIGYCISLGLAAKKAQDKSDELF